MWKKHTNCVGNSTEKKAKHRPWRRVKAQEPLAGTEREKRCVWMECGWEGKTDDNVCMFFHSREDEKGKTNKKTCGEGEIKGEILEKHFNEANKAVNDTWKWESQIFWLFFFFPISTRDCIIFLPSRSRQWLVDLRKLVHTFTRSASS